MTIIKSRALNVINSTIGPVSRCLRFRFNVFKFIFNAQTARGSLDNRALLLYDDARIMSRT